MGPKFSLLYLIDIILSIMNWFDGVEKFNTKEPNYVDGNWAPIHNEIDQILVSGQGKLPDNLISGMYIRNGANPKCWPPADRMKNHAFNGEAMLQRYNADILYKIYLIHQFISYHNSNQNQIDD